MLHLASGSLVAGRFEIDRLIGQGGMGAVYRAHDAIGGRPVALKLIFRSGNAAAELARLGREASLLATLHHPGIVGYLAHGQTPDGQLYLAMDWLDGQELRHRLDEGPVSIVDALELLRALATSLWAAHQQGIIHRDLKPSNIFLRNGRLDTPVLIDFGIARQASGAQPLTLTGSVVGTPLYMSPEQVRGTRTLGPPADLFSLGCVLYEVLTGRCPFVGDSVASTLSQILFETPTPPQQLRPEIPPPLVALLLRLLEKDPAARPADAQALLDALDTQEPPAPPATSAPSHVDSSSHRGTTTGSGRLGSDEQRLVTVLLAAPPETSKREAPCDEDEALLGTLRAAAPMTPHDRSSVNAALSGLGARVEWLSSDTLIATLGDTASAMDQVALAGRGALLLRAAWPTAQIVLTTGRASRTTTRPLGEAVDRASALFNQEVQRRAASVPTQPGACDLLVDDLSAELLAGRFDVERSAGRAILRGERLQSDEERPLLGRPVPCVGREQELGMLTALFDGCVEDSVAKAVLVTAPPGVGKSRLRREFMRRLAARGDEVTVLVTACELLGAGAPYGPIAPALRQLCSLPADAPCVQQRALLEERIAQHVPERDRERISDFLGELCRTPSPTPSTKLLAARSEPKLMSEQVLRAFVEFLRAECANRPLVLIVEDLQWSDALSVQLLDALPRDLSSVPLLVVALARPEVRELFPKLWTSPGRTEVALPGLSRKAAERLIRAVRGADLDRVAVERILDQADGNALFLEELLRAEAEGRGGDTPQSVLAMLQARLSRLEPGARHLLRAASVFGEHFARGAVAALLGYAREAAELDGGLQLLLEQEFIERRHEGRLSSEVEYAFRHNLVREAVYALVIEVDRQHWHREAGFVLERLGERDPLVLAEHFQRGAELDRASAFYLQAAEVALGADDCTGASAIVDRALACAPQDERLGGLLRVRSRALMWNLRWTEAYAAAQTAQDLLRPGESAWFEILWDLLTLSGILGHDAALEQYGSLLLTSTPPSEARLVYVKAAATVSSMYGLRARQVPAERFLRRLEELAAKLDPLDLQSHAWVSRTRSDYWRAFDPNPWSSTAESAEAVRLMLEADNRREWLFFRVFHAHSLGELGQTNEAAALLRDVALSGDELTPGYVGTACKLHLADLLVASGVRDEDSAQLDEAAQLAHDIAALGGVSDGYRRWTERLLAEIALFRGELVEAERLSRMAIAPTAAELRRLLALAVLVRVLLRRGATDEALAYADQLLAWLAAHDSAGYAELPVRLALAEALRRSPTPDRARTQLSLARALIERSAARIPDADARRRFLEEAPACVAAQRLHQAWDRAAQAPLLQG